MPKVVGRSGAGSTASTVKRRSRSRQHLIAWGEAFCPTLRALEQVFGNTASTLVQATESTSGVTVIP